MKKLLIAATLSAAAVAAAPLFAQTDQKPAQTAATEGCAMGEQGNREARHAQMGSHEGRGQNRGEKEEHKH